MSIHALGALAPFAPLLAIGTLGLILIPIIIWLAWTAKLPELKLPYLARCEFDDIFEELDRRLQARQSRPQRT
jgi:hypothetical protein